MVTSPDAVRGRRPCCARRSPADDVPGGALEPRRWRRAGSSRDVARGRLEVGRCRSALGRDVARAGLDARPPCPPAPDDDLGARTARSVMFGQPPSTRTCEPLTGGSAAWACAACRWRGRRSRPRRRSDGTSVTSPSAPRRSAPVDRAGDHLVRVVRLDRADRPARHLDGGEQTTKNARQRRRRRAARGGGPCERSSVIVPVLEVAQHRQHAAVRLVGRGQAELAGRCS